MASHGGAGMPTGPKGGSKGRPKEATSREPAKRIDGKGKY